MYFDDFKVEHIKSPVIQSEDFYPFGLTFNSYQRENSLNNDYQYNGKELQNELSLGWVDYGARMYMPEIGRWKVVDPLSETMESFTIYGYTYNNPVSLVDIMGLYPDYSYNWDTGEYEATSKNGKKRKASFDEVRKSVIQDKQGENNVLIMRDYDVTERNEKNLLTMYNAALRTGSVSIIVAKNAGDAADQLESYASSHGKINNLFIANHSNYDEPYLFFGKEIFSTNADYGGLAKIKNDSNLARIANTLASGSNVILHSCHAGSPANGGVEFAKELALKFKATVFASQSYTWTNANMFSGDYIQKGSGFDDFTRANNPLAVEYNGLFTKVTVTNGVPRVTTVYDLRYTKTGSVQYSTQRPSKNQ